MTYSVGMNSLSDDLRLAHVLADAVDQKTMSRFKAQDLHVEAKPDMSEVTDADKAAEEIIRAQLSRVRSRCLLYTSDAADDIALV